jgi:TonB family protein
MRRGKLWPVLSLLLALMVAGGTAQAQSSSTGVQLSFPRDVDSKTYQDKVREAMRQDSLRTGGKFEPGTKQMVSGAVRMDQPNQTITVTRVPITPPKAQPMTRSGHKIYTYVEQMPQLGEGGGMPALVQAVQSKISYPRAIPGETPPSGRAFVSFVVDADGTVQDTKIVKGLSPAFDAAVVAAVQQLPRFAPGKQAGQPVAVAYTLPVEFKARP